MGEERSELIRAILTAEPPDLTALRPDLDPGLASVVRKCLRKEQERRYRSAEALADDLRCWLKGEPLSSDSSASVTSLPLSPARRHPVLYFVLAPLLVLGLALAVANLFRPHQPPAPGVVLIGETGPPERFRWIPREGDVDITSGPGEPFSFKTSKVALLELLDAPPGPRYRLEAELRHDEGVPEPRFESEVGLFFAHQAYRDAESEFHGFFQTGFRDLPGSSGLWLYFRTYLGEVPFSYQQSFSPLLPLQPMRVPKVLPFWRHIAVEVTPEEIRLFSGDQLLRRVTPGMEHKPMPRINGQVIEVEPNLKGGGLGLMVWKGRGSFRNVIVTPLP